MAAAAARAAPLRRGGPFLTRAAALPRRLPPCATLAEGAGPAGSDGGADARRVERRQQQRRERRRRRVVVAPPTQRGGEAGGAGAATRTPDIAAHVRALLARRRVDDALELMKEHVARSSAGGRGTGDAVSRNTAAAVATRAVRAHSWDFAQACARSGRGDAAAAYARLVGADVKFFTEAVGAFGRARDADGLATVVGEMHACGVEPDERLYRGLVAAYGRVGRLKDARECFDAAAAGGHGRAAPLWNALADACSRCGQLSVALSLLGRMQESGVAPDAVTYNTLIAAAARAHRPELVRSLWEQMLSANSAAGDATNADRPDGAQRARGERASAPTCLQPDEHTFSTVMSAAANTADAAWAARLYTEFQPFMRDSSGAAETPSDTRGGQRNGRAQHGHRPRKRVGATKAAFVSALLTAVARGLQQASSSSADRRRWQTRVAGNGNGTRSDAAALSNAWGVARGAYEDLMGQSEYAGPSVFSAFMEAAVAANEPLLALEAAEDMHARGVDHNTYTVAGLLRACGALRGDAIDGRVSVWGELLRHEDDSAALATHIFDAVFPPSASDDARAQVDNLTVTDYFPASALDDGSEGAHGPANAPERAVREGDEVGGQDGGDGDEPFRLSVADMALDDEEALYVCNAYIKSQLDLGKRTAAFDLLSSMRPRARGLPKPDLVTYNVLISALGRERRGGNGYIAWSLVCDLREEEIVPDRCTALALLAASSQGGDARTVEAAFADLRSAGYIPDTAGWNALLAAVLKATPDDDDDSARRVLEELPASMEAQGVEPDVITYGTLLNAARRLRDVGAAAELYEIMAKRGIEPSPECHNTFASTAAKAGRVEWALDAVKRALRHSPKAVQDSTFDSIISSLCKVCPDESVLVAARLLHMLRSRGGEVALETQGALIAAAAKQGHVQLSLSLYKDACARAARARAQQAQQSPATAAPIPAVARGSLVDALCHAGMAEEAWEVAGAPAVDTPSHGVDANGEAEGGFQHDGADALGDRTVMRLITASVRGGSGAVSLTRALSYYDALKRREGGATRLVELPRRGGGAMWTCLIEACVREGELERALGVFDDMRACRAAGGASAHAGRATLAYLSSACMRDVLYRPRVREVAAQLQEEQTASLAQTQIDAEVHA